MRPWCTGESKWLYKVICAHKVMGELTQGLLVFERLGV